MDVELAPRATVVEPNVTELFVRELFAILLKVFEDPEIVLLVRVSEPARVASVPVVGNVTAVLAVAVSDVVNAPEVVKLPPRVIVLDPLLTPVPPYVGPTIVPCQTPVPIVPTEVSEEPTTVVPNAVAESIETLLILNTLPVGIFQFSELVQFELVLSQVIVLFVVP